MDAVDHIRLEKKRKELRETVAFKYIAAYLLRDGVLNSEEFQLISHNVTMQAQMDTLLEVLVRKGRSAYLSFVSTLEEDYSWLANDLKTVSVTAQDLADYLKNTTNVNDQNDNHIKSSMQSEKKGIFHIHEIMLYIVSKTHCCSSQLKYLNRNYSGHGEHLTTKWKAS